jgi:hypothetical protein
VLGPFESRSNGTTLLPQKTSPQQRSYDCKTKVG